MGAPLTAPDVSIIELVAPFAGGEDTSGGGESKASGDGTTSSDDGIATGELAAVMTASLAALRASWRHAIAMIFLSAAGT